MTHQVASGHNNAAGLTALSLQPRCPGISYNFVADGDGISDIKGTGFTAWVYDSMTAVQFETIMTELGLDYGTTPSKKVTVRIPKNEAATNLDRDDANYNAIVTAPPRPTFEFFWKRVEFTLTGLETL